MQSGSTPLICLRLFFSNLAAFNSEIDVNFDMAGVGCGHLVRL